MGIDMEDQYTVAATKVSSIPLPLVVVLRARVELAAFRAGQSPMSDLDSVPEEAGLEINFLYDRRYQYCVVDSYLIILIRSVRSWWKKNWSLLYGASYWS